MHAAASPPPCSILASRAPLHQQHAATRHAHVVAALHGVQMLHTQTRHASLASVSGVIVTHSTHTHTPTGRARLRCGGAQRPFHVLCTREGRPDPTAMHEDTSNRMAATRESSEQVVKSTAHTAADGEAAARGPSRRGRRATPPHTGVVRERPPPTRVGKQPLTRGPRAATTSRTPRWTSTARRAWRRRVAAACVTDLRACAAGRRVIEP
mmetsp:Transcript_9371/g.24983  ORF Transcript_9371/g.24983 Transcript_9371/m.24983 type:complete len:210 (+) Transcript_9371:170-799(+)